MNFLEDDTYVRWNEVRANWLLSKYGSGYFQNKTLVELGAGSGALGQKFSKWGAKVTCVEAREEHIRDGRKLYPKPRFVLMDLEQKGKLKELGEFDIVVHFGTLYHLRNWERNLRESLQICKKIMFLETEVMDSLEDEELRVNEHKEFWDQSFSGIGTRPSPFSIERVIKQEGFKAKIQLDSKLNVDELHVYDWEHTNNKRWRNGLRRFWVVTK